MKKIISFIVLVTISLSIYAQYDFDKKPYILFQNMESEDPNFTYSPELEYLMVRWQLDEPNTSIIRWGQGSYQFIASPDVDPNDNTLYYYSFPLADLDEQAMYMYKVEITDGDYASGTFRTPPSADATNITFFAYGDTRGSSTLPPENHDSVCEAILNEILQDYPEPTSQTLLIHTGDWNWDDTEDKWQEDYFNLTHLNALEVKSILSIMGVFGNHESPGINFKKYWPYSYEGTNTGFCYSFDYGPVHFCFVELPLWDATLSQYKKDWIEADLNNTEKEWKVMIFHAPGYSNSDDNHANNEEAQNYLQPLCVSKGVQLVLNGHNHYYAHWLVEGVHHLTLG